MCGIAGLSLARVPDLRVGSGACFPTLQSHTCADGGMTHHVVCVPFSPSGTLLPGGILKTPSLFC